MLIPPGGTHGFSSFSSRGTGILPVRINRARHGQDAHATVYYPRSVTLIFPNRSRLSLAQ